jgi:hypothetical protein
MKFFFTLTVTLVSCITIRTNFGRQDPDSGGQ